MKQVFHLLLAAMAGVFCLFPILVVAVLIRLHPAVITVPTLALNYTWALRELKVQETLYATLTSQYEQAKLAEARDTPTVQVLDPAIPAERKSKPSIPDNMMIAGALSLFVGIFFAFFLEYLRRFMAQQKEQPTS